MIRRPRPGSRWVALVGACVLLVGCSGQETVSDVYGGGPTISNETSSVLVLREYSFGDGPETTSGLDEIGPGAEHEVSCGFLREYRLENAAGMVLPVFVSCASAEPLVITDADLKNAS